METKRPRTAEEGEQIGEVAQRAGVRPSALRYYERVGLLPEPRREAGRRRYDSGVLCEVLGQAGGRRGGAAGGFHHR